MTASQTTKTSGAAALAAELTAAFRAAVGREVPAMDAGAVASEASGWIVALTAGGAWRGTATAWWSNEIVGALPGRTADGAADPDEAAVGEALRSIASQAAQAMTGRPAFARSTWSIDVRRGALAGAGAATVDFDFGDAGHVRLSVSADLSPVPAAGQADDRLAAVLDVDLPLVVRFGTTVAPLRTLSALAAGSLIDMHRSPDDPVELLIGDRVVARGAVVAVDGHYGVRITELTAARPAGLEA